MTLKHLQNERIKLMNRSSLDSDDDHLPKTRLFRDQINYKRKLLNDDLTFEWAGNNNESSYCLISDSESKSCDSWTPKSMTPAKMRSSLARPVRVHDSRRSDETKPIMSYAFDNQRINLLASAPSNNLVVDAAPTTAIDDNNLKREFASSIHMRLEDMLEMARGKRGRSLPKHGFKDTQLLLDAALALNNADQGNRYNVKRCSLM